MERSESSGSDQALGHAATTGSLEVHQPARLRPDHATWPSLARRVVIAAVVGGVACSGGETATESGATSTTQPTQITFVSGSTAGEVGTALAAPLVVRVEDGQGRPVRGVTLTWTPATASGGSVTAPVTTTDAAGRATNAWTLGPRSGAQAVTVAGANLPSITISATAAPGPMAALVLAPDTVTLVPNQTVFAAVAGTDRFGNAVSPSAPNALTWATSDARVLSVSTDGIIRALAPGSAQVRATAGAIGAAARVVVVAPPQVDVAGTVRGTVQIPTSVPAASVYVTNHAGAAVAANADGTFAIQAPSDVTAELFAKSGDRVVGLALVPPTVALAPAASRARQSAGASARALRTGAPSPGAAAAPVSIDGLSSALALVAAAPPFARLPAEGVDSLLIRLRSVPAVTAFGEALRQSVVRTGALPDATDAQFLTSYQEAVAAALHALSAPAGGASLRVAQGSSLLGGSAGGSPSLMSRSAGIDLVPNSGLSIGRCYGTTPNVRCVVRNTLQRRVDVYLLPAADDGTPLVDPATLQAKDRFTIAPTTWFCNPLDLNCWYRITSSDIAFDPAANDVEIPVVFRPGRARYAVYAYGLGGGDSNIGTPLSPAEARLIADPALESVIDFFVLPAVARLTNLGMPKLGSPNHAAAVALLRSAGWAEQIWDCTKDSRSARATGGCVATVMLDKLKDDATLEKFVVAYLTSQGKSSGQVKSALKNMQKDLAYLSGLYKAVDALGQGVEWYQAVEPLLYGVKRQVLPLQYAAQLGVDHLEVRLGRQQTGTPGSTLADRLVVVVRDKNDQPVSGAFVHWVADAGSGAPETEYVTTGVSGVASTAWTVGQSVGTQHMTAIVDGTATVRTVFTATVQQPAGPPSPTGPATSGLSTNPTRVVAGQPFVFTINGARFDAATIRVAFTGPSCPASAPCVVANADLTTKTASTVVGSANLLNAGTFTVAIQLGATGSLITAGTLTVEAPPATGPRPTALTTSPAAPTAGQAFTATVDGSGFDPATVQVVITGPSCATAAPCVVPNDVLPTKTASRVVALVTLLNPGTFVVGLRNGVAGTVAPAGTVTVGAAAPAPSGLVTSPGVPVAGQPFTATISGVGFDPASIRIVITGPNCPSATPCVVPNAVLTAKSASSISGPVTLNVAGTFAVSVQHGVTGTVVPVGTLAVVAPAVAPTTSGLSTNPASPVAGQTFTVTVSGANFDPATIQVLFTGPSCAAAAPCVVPTAVLTTRTATVVSGPATLNNAGAFTVAIRHGAGGTPITAGTVTVAAPGPTVTGFSSSPSTPTAGQPFTFTVTGGNFDPTIIRVLFVGPSCPSSAPCVVPNAVMTTKTSGSVGGPATLNNPGTFSVAIQHGTTGTPVSAGSVTVAAPQIPTPTVSGLSTTPNAPIAGQQFSVRITGANFDPATVQVVVTGPSCPSATPCVIPTNVLTASPTNVTGPVTLNNAGTFAIAVRNGAGGAPVGAGTLTVAAPTLIPTTAGLSTSPNAPVAGQPFTFLVSGGSFDPSTIQVLFTGPNCASSSPCVVPNSVLTTRTATGAGGPATLNTAGTFMVAVRNGPSGAAVTAGSVTVAAPGPVIPSVTGLSTNPAAPRRGQAFSFTITGSNFDPATVEVLVTGPSCPAGSPCVIPNNTLSTRTTSTVVGSATLNNPGTFGVALRNGGGGVTVTAGSVTIP